MAACAGRRADRRPAHAEFAVVRGALGVGLVDWLRDRAIDLAREDLDKWQTLDTDTWRELAERLADEAAQERQRPAG